MRQLFALTFVEVWTFCLCNDIVSTKDIFVKSSMRQREASTNSSYVSFLRVTKSLEIAHFKSNSKNVTQNEHQRLI